MFNKKGIIESKQKTLTCFLSVSKTNSQPKPDNENMRENGNKRTLRRPGLVFLESSSDEENSQYDPQLKIPNRSEYKPFVPSPRKYKLNSIEDIIKEDTKYQNALDKIQKNLETNAFPENIENSTFMDDSISPIKSQHAEKTLITKYLGESDTISAGKFYVSLLKLKRLYRYNKMFFEELTSDNIALKIVLSCNICL